MHKAIVTPGTGAGWKQRVAAAERRRDEIRAHDTDPRLNAIARVRKAHADLLGVERAASIVWAKLNSPVELVLPRTMHPQRVAAIRALMADWSPDHTQALEPTPTVAELAGERAVVARAELEAANAALAEIDGVPVQPVAMAPIVTETIAPVAAVTAPEEPIAPRGRGRPRKSDTPALSARLAAEGAIED